MNENVSSLMYFIPETLLALGVVLYLLGLTFLKSSRALAFLGYAILILVLGSLLPQLNLKSAFPLFHHLLEADFLSVVLRLGVGVAALVTVSFVIKTKPTLVFFVLTALLGMHLMILSQNLIVTVIGIELLSTSSYVMAGINRQGRFESEAALKYIIFGAFSAGLMIFGTSYLYGFAHSLQLSVLADMANATPNDLFLILGTVLFLAGLAFKIAAVPLHFWAPDVYAGAPLAVTAFLASASKLASFIVLLRFLMVLTTAHWLSAVLWTMAAAGMLWGNLGALLQTKLKRLMAYSSMAHTGYMLVGFATLGTTGFFAGVFYMGVYLLVTLGAFVLLLFLTRDQDNDDFEMLRGLFWNNPYLASAFTVILAALTGLPPTAGFIGKFYLFSAAVNQGYFVLAGLGLLTSVISLVYYMNLVRIMFQKPEGSEKVSSLGLAQGFVFVVALGLLFLGLYWLPLENLIKACLSF